MVSLPGTQLFEATFLLRRWSYSIESAFLPSTSCKSILPASHAAFEDLISDPPFHVAATGRILREKVDRIAILDNYEGLQTEEKQRALKILGFVAHAYIWGDGNTEILQQLPPQLAIPLHSLAEELGIAPLATYATTVLWNCSLIQPERGWCPENVEVDLTFTGTSDEELFYAVSACVEAAGAEAVNSLILIASSISHAHEAGVQPDEKLIVGLFDCTITALAQMVRLLKQVLKMKSELFYWKMRPYFAGWGLVKGEETGLRAGVHYAGIDPPGETRKYVGISAAQSSLFQTIDVLLGVQHDEHQHSMLRNVRSHMPRDHRHMVEELEASYSSTIKLYVEGTPALLPAYNGVLDQIVRFRRVHLSAATKYAVREADRRGKTSFGLAKGTQAGGGAIGAGGSDLKPFLQGLVNCTRATRISTSTLIERSVGE
ncbi:hypothetical protein M409DRAFT_56562 [Zasmidium cellare ATCC 36951]|uniref:Indoleamine 2,3-dioxygenase n=1 Tax=Zasmidium cellare ATCC 36951 TaxID=1080233 RepID=A0A6A6CAS9_ZASCE|nr:uncharacterized protein M409DRAFT_56562 [Zasmidium cellare ATCC 36951]KAF2164274.1 hypothetical protein M409DRAFT_56562 [Zasmidium cellare ATCC 36951]